MSQQQQRTPLEHSQTEQQKRDSWTRREHISKSIDACGRLLARAGAPRESRGGDAYARIAVICLEKLAPLLRDETGGQLWDNTDAFEESRHQQSLMLFLRRRPRAVGPGDAQTKRLIKQAFEAMAGIAEYEGIIEGEYENSVEVRGHALPLGKMHTKWEDTIEGPVHIVDPDGSPPVSITQGTRGFGKSTSLAREVLDRYYAGKKIVDVADLSELENGVYDLNQQQQDLRDVLEALGLPPDFDAADRDPPKLEVYVPVTPALGESKLPFKADSDESIVVPFTIPAASIPRRVLNMMLSHLTDVQQTYLDRAYQSIDTREHDWSLLDLADEVLATDAQEGVKRRVYNTLAELQGVGFIRTRDCPHAIDWESIFRDQETITAFSMSKMDEKAHKFMVLAYLIHSLYPGRDRFEDLPPAAGAFRELHNIAPTDRVASEDEREREIQSGLVAAFQDLASEGRHVNLEILADTQQFVGQVNKRVREHVERVVTFRSQFGVLKPLFKDMIGLDGDRYNYMTTIAREFDPGQAAVLGYTGTNRSLEMPIDFAPPLCHHIDADKGESGWQMRAEVLDEELRPVPWDCSVPEHLQFETLSEGEDGSGDASMSRYEVFAERCLKEAPQEGVVFERVKTAFENAMDSYGRDGDIRPSVLSQGLGRQLSFESEDSNNMDKPTRWVGVTLTAEGERYADQ